MAVLLTVTAMPPASASATASPSARLRQTGVLTSPDPHVYSLRSEGTAVSMSGDGRTLVSGAPSPAHERGRAYVFHRDDAGRWGQPTVLSPLYPALKNSNWGTAVSISNDGNHIAIGDSSDSAVDTFHRTASGWRPTGRLRSSYPSWRVTWFGWSVALSGDGRGLIVGEPGAPGSADYAIGAAWIYPATASGDWSSPQRLAPPRAQAPIGFAESVALSGDGRTAVFGSLALPGYPQTGGHVLVYAVTGAGTWALTQTLVTRGGGMEGFGSTLAISDDASTIIAGSGGIAGSIGENVAPSVEVFDHRPNGWARSAIFTGQDTARTGQFGQSGAVSADGGTVLISAPWRTADHGARPLTGGAYRFVREGAGWRWGGTVYSATSRANETLGWSVALSSDGSSVALGAPNYRGPGRASANGGVYLFHT